MNDSRVTILVCDDDRLVLTTLASGLRGAGFGVIEADNGDDAILLAREHRPDLALLDMRLSGRSGMDVAAYLRDHVGTPFMFLSAFGDEQLIRQAADEGALAYLVKPMEIRRIVPAVKAALARAGGTPPPRPPSSGADDDRSGVEAEPIGSGEPTLSIGVSLGILMERFALTRAEALARLDAWARQDGRLRAEAASDLAAMVDAINAIGRPDGP